MIIDIFYVTLRTLEDMRRTTVRIDDQLLADAKAYAAQRHRSLNSVIEDALRDLLWDRFPGLRWRHPLK